MYKAKGIRRTRTIVRFGWLPTECVQTSANIASEPDKHRPCSLKLVSKSILYSDQQHIRSLDVFSHLYSSDAPSLQAFEWKGRVKTHGKLAGSFQLAVILHRCGQCGPVHSPEFTASFKFSTVRHLEPHLLLDCSCKLCLGISFKRECRVTRVLFVMDCKFLIALKHSK